VKGDERRLVEDDPAALCVDAGIGGAEIDGEIGSEMRECHVFAARSARSIPAAH